MNYSDFSAAKTFIKEKAMALMVHEKNNYVKVSFPLNNYKIYDIKGRLFYAVETSIFREIVDDVLLDAYTKLRPSKIETSLYQSYSVVLRFV